MNTALLFGTTAVLTVTGAATLPFLMHRLEGGLAARSPRPATTADTTPPAAFAVDGAPLAQPDVA